MLGILPNVWSYLHAYFSRELTDIQCNWSGTKDDVEMVTSENDETFQSCCDEWQNGLK